MPENVYRQDRHDSSSRVTIAELTSRGGTVVAQEGAQLAGVKLPVVLIHVHEGRPGSDITNGVGGSDEREGRYHYLVFRLHARQQECRVQSGGATGCGDGVPHSQRRGKLALEALDKWSGC